MEPEGWPSLAEGGGLENRFSRKETGVRIPLPPPFLIVIDITIG